MVNRFEQYYGPVNDVFFIEGHALVVVNAMNVDPAADRFMREQTLQHIRVRVLALCEINNVVIRCHSAYWILHLQKIAEQVAHEKLRVILLEHIPLAKPDGACVDPWLYRTTKCAVHCSGGDGDDDVFTPFTSPGKALYSSRIISHTKGQQDC